MLASGIFCILGCICLIVGVFIVPVKGGYDGYVGTDEGEPIFDDEEKQRKAWIVSLGLMIGGGLLITIGYLIHRFIETVPLVS